MGIDFLYTYKLFENKMTKKNFIRVIYQLKKQYILNNSFQFLLAIVFY